LLGREKRVDEKERERGEKKLRIRPGEKQESEKSKYTCYSKTIMNHRRKKCKKHIIVAQYISRLNKLT
jgi:hypothetical protein